MDAHKLRKEIDACIFVIEERLKGETTSRDHNRALELVRTKLQEAKMWAGKVLEAENSQLPEEFRDEAK